VIVTGLWLLSPLAGNLLLLAALSLNLAFIYLRRSGLGYGAGYGLLVAVVLIAFLILRWPYLAACAAGSGCSLDSSFLGVLLAVLSVVFVLYAAPSSLLLLAADHRLPSTRLNYPARPASALGAHMCRLALGSLAGLAAGLLISALMWKGAAVAWVSLGHPELPANRPPRALQGYPAPDAPAGQVADQVSRINAAFVDRAQFVTQYGWTYDVRISGCHLDPSGWWVNAEDTPRAREDVWIQSDRGEDGFWIAPEPTGAVDRASARTCSGGLTRRTEYVVLADGTAWVWTHEAGRLADADHTGALLLGPWAGYLVGLLVVAMADRKATKAALAGEIR
jgi:hypothetical protein